MTPTKYSLAIFFSLVFFPIGCVYSFYENKISKVDLFICLIIPVILLAYLWSNVDFGTFEKLYLELIFSINLIESSLLAVYTLEWRTENDSYFGKMPDWMLVYIFVPFILLFSIIGISLFLLVGTNLFLGFNFDSAKNIFLEHKIYLVIISLWLINYLVISLIKGVRLD